ncbi:T9SS type A sorting domain-containing protein [Pontibacter sp. 13R65]|uniref:T9SS type A sorting domain-containing protein n=1 Tax=Pontibacter sp. 13R65 TaxID=3127458 RepID=UPI00301B7D25
MKNLNAILVAGLLLCAGFGAKAQTRPTNQVKPPLQNSITPLLPQTLNKQLHATQTTIRVPQTEIEYSWSDATATWTPLYEHNSEYDNHGWRSQLTTKDLTENKLLSLITHQYDAQGRDTLLIMQENEAGAWVNATRARTKYNDQGHVTYMATFRWHNASWQLVHAHRYNYTYGPGDRVEQVVKQLYGGTTWTNADKEEFSYTGNGTLPESKTNYTHTETGWTPTQRFANITYNLTDQREQSYVKQTRTSTEWQNTSFHTFTYTTNSTTLANITEEEVHRYNGTGTVLERKIMEEYLSNGHFMQHKEEVLVNGQWLVDTENSLLGYGINEPQGGGFTEFIYQTYSYTPQGNLIYVNLAKHMYSDFINITVTGAADEIPATAVMLYPNPSKDLLHIALAATTTQEAMVSIYNLTGQKVYELADLRGEATINLAHLPGGIYLVNVKGTNSAGVTKKIVKQ